MFSSSIVPPDRKETKLGNSDQEVSPSAGKNNEVALLPCSCMEVCLFPVVCQVPVCHLLQQIIFQ